MMTSHVNRWPASFGYHQVCSKARRARLHRMRRPQCADWCALHARHYPGPLCSGGITPHPRYYGPMRESCGLHAPSTLVS